MAKRGRERAREGREKRGRVGRSRLRKERERERERERESIALDKVCKITGLIIRGIALGLFTL